MDESIHIEPYSATWPGLFEAERRNLVEILAPWLAGPIEHIGSTSVPGLSSKPIIDIMAAVGGLEQSRDAIPAIERIGYCYAPYRQAVMHWFCKPSPSFRTHHLHLVPYASDLWKERIAFRDKLRASRPLAEEYAALKRHLAEVHSTDREAYTEAKTSFIRRAVHGAA
ncbi:MAG: GrpB family protein [Bradyrhizobium sp.]|uniref:GrpB family protein n=1 Tax=Bradyrhizobium sp. TaxID=376 RepID=UPI003D0BA50C